MAYSRDSNLRFSEEVIVTLDFSKKRFAYPRCSLESRERSTEGRDCEDLLNGSLNNVDSRDCSARCTRWLGVSVPGRRESPGTPRLEATPSHQACQGEGPAVRQKDGAWWLFINYRGKRKAKRIGEGDAGKRAAKTAASKIEAKLALGHVGILDDQKPLTVPTFEIVAKQWEQLTTPNWKQGTQITYGNALRCHLIATFGSLPMDKVTPDRIEAWWTDIRRKGFSKKHLAILRSVLRGVCRRAVRIGFVRANAADCIEGSLGRQDAEIHQAEYHTPEDLTRFLATPSGSARRTTRFFW